jgi:hypothetical protein
MSPPGLKVQDREMEEVKVLYESHLKLRYGKGEVLARLLRVWAVEL